MKKTASEIAKIALCVCIIAVLSQLSIAFPTGVPLTFQTFAIVFCACFLGLKKGLFAIVSYLAVGAAGVPVFSNFGGGIGVFFGPTGGFLIGFVPLTIACALGASVAAGINKNRSDTQSGLSEKNISGATRQPKHPAVFEFFTAFAVAIPGLLICHALGVAQFCLISGAEVLPAFLSVSLPFLPKDLLSFAGGYLLAKKIKFRLNIIRSV